jgi:hypothetical protein
MGWDRPLLQDSGRRLAELAAGGRYTNSALTGVFKRGFITGFHKREANCPYQDKRQRFNRATGFSQGYIKAWRHGYQLGKEARTIFDKGVSGGEDPALVEDAI